MVEISKIVRSNRKTLSVLVTGDGEVVVKAPLKLPESEINKFISEKESWIISKLKAKTQVINKFQDVISYKKLLVFGSAYNGYFSPSVKEIALTSDKILIPNKITPQKLNKCIIKWYKSLADSVVINRTKEISKHIGINPKIIKCTGSRGRWGACNSNKEVFITWRAVMLPERLIDYIIVHELSHIIELNHSPKFWAIVGKILPDYKSRRAELKTYSFALNLF